MTHVDKHGFMGLPGFRFLAISFIVYLCGNAPYTCSRLILLSRGILNNCLDLSLKPIEAAFDSVEHVPVSILPPK